MTAAKPPAPVVVTATDADTELTALRALYDQLKDQAKQAEEKLKQANERLGVVKTKLTDELYRRTGGAPRSELRIPGVAGGLRSQLVIRTGVNRTKLEAGWPEVFEAVKTTNPTWEVREVK